MGSGFSDLFDEVARQAIEDNLEGFICFCTQATQGEIHASSTLTWVINQAKIPFLNGVLRTRVEPDNLPATIESTLAIFRE
jgi:hypothetical protein